MNEHDNLEHEQINEELRLRHNCEYCDNIDPEEDKTFIPFALAIIILLILGAWKAIELAFDLCKAFGLFGGQF